MVDSPELSLLAAVLTYGAHVKGTDDVPVGLHALTADAGLEEVRVLIGVSLESKPTWALEVSNLLVVFPDYLTDEGPLTDATSRRLVGTGVLTSG
ncbi:MAG: hypothetical protein RDU20_09470 [Desulfomonilaceae bacterium]|nr:hypothetical protein [Desulfomonilaceae bacterium]